MKRRETKPTLADRQFAAGVELVNNHALWCGLFERVRISRRRTDVVCAKETYLRVAADGRIWINPEKLAAPDEWAYLLAHAMLHLAWGHFQRDRAYWAEWNAACDVVIARFLQDLKFGIPPMDRILRNDVPPWDEARWYREFCESGVDAELANLGLSAAPQTGMWLDAPKLEIDPKRPIKWAQIFAHGLRTAMQGALENVAALHATSASNPLRRLCSATQRARAWFMTSFPLLSSLVASFDFIEDADVCRRADIRVAAVSELTREIYINPLAALDEQELRFVIAHEVLHVGLRHQDRCRGRDSYLWNVACDFVINGWLIELGVGTAPTVGGLHDPQLNGLSAEVVYDRITADLRRYRKLLTLAGTQCDMLERAPTRGDPLADLDEFYRAQLAKGFALHEQQCRGLLPADLVEEIRALAQPPIGWDVQLARWFDAQFPPLERRRSYARASRRQASTPDIPRPAWHADTHLREGRVFGVVLDTSGSMDRALLAKALGSIASYSEARDIAAARVVFCDARAYDAGYLAPAEIAGRVQVRGRGGTILQPGVDLLQSARDFPASGPILVITDGWCDSVRIRNEHAFLVPVGARLPFVPAGPVFRLH